MKFKFELGKEAQDTITGFKGYIIWRVEYLTGCNQYGLQPQMKKGDKEAPAPKQFEENALTLTGKSITLPAEEEQRAQAEKEGKRVPGGPKTIANNRKHLGK